MAVVAEAYEAPTTITKAMLPLLKNRGLSGAFEVMRRRGGGSAGSILIPEVNVAPRSHRFHGDPSYQREFNDAAATKRGQT
jgi:hypothetical protein